MRAARRTETPDTEVSPLRRLVGGSRSRGPGHEHLVDAVAVHVHDLKGEPVPLKAIARRRHAPDVGHHHPAYGLVVLLLLVGQSTQPNTFFKLFGGQQAVHQPGAVSPLHYRRLAVLLEVANEGLEDVGRRDEPLDIAALVDHEGQGQDGSLERRERLRSGSAFREERWAPQGSQQIDRPSFSDLLGKGVFDRDHAQQIVEIAPGDRVVRVPALSYQPSVLLRRVVGVQPDDVGARRHQRAYRAVVEPERALGKVTFFVLEDARVCPFLEQDLDLPLAYRRLGGGPYPQEPQHRVGRYAEKPDRWGSQGREEAHGPRHARGNRFGAVQGQTLGHQLSQDQREVGDERYHHAEGDGSGVRREAGNGAREGSRQGLGYRRPAHGAGQDPDQGDPDLHGGEETIRRVGKLQRVAGLAVTRIGTLPKACLAGRNQGRLRHGEETVEEGQHYNNRDLYQEVRHLGNRSFPWRLLRNPRRKKRWR